MPQAMKNIGYRVTPERWRAMRHRTVDLGTDLKKLIDRAVDIVMSAPDDGLDELERYAIFLGNHGKTNDIRRDLAAQIAAEIELE